MSNSGKHAVRTSQGVASFNFPLAVLFMGLDVIGEIAPKASNGHRFILVTINYSTKRVEAESFASVTKRVVARFIQNNILCQYGTPEV